MSLGDKQNLKKGKSVQHFYINSLSFCNAVREKGGWSQLAATESCSMIKRGGNVTMCGSVTGQEMESTSESKKMYVSVQRELAEEREGQEEHSKENEGAAM